MNHPPLILISCGTVPHPMSPRRSLSVLYGGALERAGCLGAAWTGGRPQELARRFDGLLLSGGGDLEASLFGQARHPRAGDPDLARDHAELALLEAFCTLEKPALGICRGVQVLNVFFGGNLIQHLDGHDGAPHPVRTAPRQPVPRLVRRGVFRKQLSPSGGWPRRQTPAMWLRARRMARSKRSNTNPCPFMACNGIPSAWCRAS